MRSKISCVASYSRFSEKKTQCLPQRDYGIKKQITFHVARHTFATTVTLQNGVSIESVSRMLGHTNLKTTQHYARIVDQKIADDMRQLTMSGKFQLA
ncbi:tyrosine-type recombinase/integrase [Phaeocystidibacter marisrubri]|uniref:Tyrosine-type recombinase/integrase n=1 Tax=Phaeocystidibacter marisrubri TaxID=1577780 RepID=A0A6L3ZD82_9FLAO|nr:tyrosine-type recombinase/integrase [Phaeocystidibacter marisrubri]